MSTPYLKQEDDVAALCSFANLNPAGYRRFPGAMKIQPPAEPGPTPAPQVEALQAALREPPPAPVPEAAPPESPRRSPLPFRVNTGSAPRHRSALDRVLGRGPRNGAEGWTRHASQTLLPFCHVAGGTGVSTVMATLARVLSRNRQRVALVDAEPQSPLVLLFGGDPQASAGLASFVPSAASGEGAVHVVSPDASLPLSRQDADAWLWRDLARVGHHVEHVLVDVWPGCSEHVVERLLCDGLYLTVLVPDLRCVFGIAQLHERLAAREQMLGRAAVPYFLLNCFEERVPFHQDIRNRLKQELGDRLLPFAIPRTDEIPEAAAEGMTVRRIEAQHGRGRGHLIDVDAIDSRG